MYVAVKGGREAIENAAKAFRHQQVRNGSDPLHLEQIRDQLSLAVDRVMGEGGMYDPDYGALALKQCAGDVLEASFMLRAFCTTQPRLGYSLPTSTSEMRVIRRISAAFKDIPGGQVLGPTSDYLLRLLNFELMKEEDPEYQQTLGRLLEELPEADPLPVSFPKVVDLLREEGLLAMPETDGVAPPLVDITRESLSFPAPRSAALQAMARAETGGLLALAYSSMRGYGMIHPTVGELRVGYLPVHVVNPYTGEKECIGEAKVTEAEIISETRDDSGDLPRFSLGYGLCLGHNETKAISMAVLDRSTQAEEPQAPSEDQEFVLLHTEGIESMGFCNHFKLPHYVTFQSALDRLRTSREKLQS